MSFKKLSPNTEPIAIARLAVEKHGQGKPSSVDQYCGSALSTRYVCQQCEPTGRPSSVGLTEEFPPPPPLKEARTQMSMFGVCEIKVNDVLKKGFRDRKCIHSAAASPAEGNAEKN